MDSDGDIQVLVAPQSYATRVFGPRFAGRLLAFGLYGICFSIYTRYFLSQHFRMDSAGMRCCIILVMASNTGATILLAVDTVSQAIDQERTVAYFGVKMLDETTYDYFSFFASILPQLFLARRAFVLTVRARSLVAPSGSGAWRKPVPLLVLSVLILSISASLLGYCADLSVDTKSYFDAEYDPTFIEAYGFTVALLASAVTDVITSVVLAWHWMRWLRANKGFNRRTDSVLRQLIVTTIVTTVFTTIPAGVAAILQTLQTASSNQVLGAVCAILSDSLPPLYTIALFTNLGLRRSLRNRQPFQMTAPTLPTLQQTKTRDADHRIRTAPNSTLASKSDGEPDRLAVELESGGSRNTYGRVRLHAYSDN